ncbi:MAG TPA: hypothetical protein IAC03_05050 [Candidatus Coprenecus pullistercoris]|nr:hypothetical protein [Candidatus Coprenecus pullistercoris]
MRKISFALTLVSALFLSFSCRNKGEEQKPLPENAYEAFILSDRYGLYNTADTTQGCFYYQPYTTQRLHGKTDGSHIRFGVISNNQSTYFVADGIPASLELSGTARINLIQNVSNTIDESLTADFEVVKKDEGSGRTWLFSEDLNYGIIILN